MLHLVLCVENLGSSSYGHLLVSVTKIIVEIYKIYFMEHSILRFTLLLEITSLLSFIVSYKRSQKSFQFFHINIKNICFLKNYFKSHHKIQTHLIEEISGTTSAISLLESFKPVSWERSVIDQSIGHLLTSLA